MGEKVLNVAMYGSAHDTMGYEEMPDLPELPNGCDADDYLAVAKTPEFKELKAERAVIAKRNKEKRKRAKAIRRGENINMRRDKVKGERSIVA